MPRYIDAEELWIQLDKLDSFEQGRNHAYYKGLRKAKRILSKQPTADVKEVKHGHWNKTCVPDVYQCDVCKKPVKMDEFCDSEVLREFCPKCGADMREEKDNG